MERTYDAAQAKRQGLPAFNGTLPTLLNGKKMSEHGQQRPALPPVVTMNWCASCATPLPSEWTVCPGCDLYGNVLEALGHCDAARAAARLLERNSGGLSVMAEAGIALSMGLTEAASEFRLRREVVRRSMNDLQARAHANARNRRRNRGSNAGTSASVRVGAGGQPRSGALSTTTTPHPPLPAGWAMVWCPQGNPYYWHYANNSAQWEMPEVAQPTEQRALVACEPGADASSGSGREVSPPEPRDLGAGCLTRPSLRIRFANTHGMSQVAQAFPTSWEPEPTPREGEHDDASPSA